ncbi:MAG TPA: PatB family C-S lyase [Gammaproteobacteria bacterium]|nr:PatB family C-S lyase [Gammaproteobacteria bacterium]
MRLELLSIERLRARHNNKWRYYPDDVLPAWVADMDFAAATPIREFMRRMADSSDFCYPLKPPYPQLEQVLSERMRERFGWSVDGAPVELVNDVVQGICIALETLGERGQGTVIQPPIYGPFLEATRDLQRPAVFNPLIVTEHSYAIDFDQLERAAAEGARFLLLCNPHNPSGRVFTRNELERLAQVALRHGLVILSDEIHADLVYPGNEHIPVAMLDPEVAARTVTFVSASKAFNTAGLRSALVVFGSESLHRRFSAFPRRLRGGPNAFGAEAMRIAWAECGEWLQAALAYLEGNRDRVARTVSRQMPGIRYRKPEATYFAWLDCRDLGLDEEPYDFFLREARVALEPGLNFGPQGAGFARLNFATSKKILSQILTRMGQALSTLG